MSLSNSQNFYVKTVIAIVLLALVSLFFQPSAEAAEKEVGPSDELVGTMMYESQCYILAKAAKYHELTFLHGAYVSQAIDVYPEQVIGYLEYILGVVEFIVEDSGNTEQQVGEFFYAKFCYQNSF